MEHDDLTRLIRQQLDTLHTTTATEASASGPSSTGVVYELYGNATNPTTTLEDRLVRLEKAIGSQSSSTKTLLQRLEEMEALVKTVDATTLEQTSNKAKIIRADLEAASKARNKLTATYKKEDSKMIQQLHTQLVELEGLSDYLPALVERLQQLANLHVQAGTFAARLEALETSANQLANSVAQVEGTMDQLANNLTQNLTTMEGNLKVLDERLNKL
jgi:DNA repair exonuclease SbcCD ATPase subunit